MANRAEVRVLRALKVAPKGRSLREIADLTGLSPRGAALVLARLVDGEFITQENRKQEKESWFFSRLRREDQALLEVLYQREDASRAADRVERYSKRAASVLPWIEESYCMWRRARSGKWRRKPR